MPTDKNEGFRTPTEKYVIAYAKAEPADDLLLVNVTDEQVARMRANLLRLSSPATTPERENRTRKRFES